MKQENVIFVVKSVTFNLCKKYAEHFLFLT